MLLGVATFEPERCDELLVERVPEFRVKFKDAKFEEGIVPTTATLTSLAILRVNLEERRGDYLENLRPFILQTLFTHSPEPVTDTTVADHIQKDFGLVIPRRTVQRVLRRLAADAEVNLTEDLGKLHITGRLVDPGILSNRQVVEQDIGLVLGDIRMYSQTTSKPLSGDDEAVAAIAAFLSQFDITCLSAYERGTAIPDQSTNLREDIILTSDYVRNLQENNPDMFERFIVLVKGHMLANALMCPDLEDTPMNYDDVTFYLDTPLLVHWLGLESEQEREAARELVDMVRELGGNFSVFTHTLDELENVISAAADQITEGMPMSTIARESSRRATTAVELKLMATQVETNLQEGEIVAELTPPYDAAFQVDEDELGRILEERVGYRSDVSRSHDINSVRSVYAVRRDIPARSLETSKAVLVTSNGKFAEASWHYGRSHFSSRHVSPVIADFSLANMAWLKTPVEADSVPITQLLAFSYAALRPPEQLWRRYLAEIDKLQEEGVISEDEHALLRSYELANPELMHLTLGEDAAFKQETVTQTVERVTRRITKEADDRLKLAEEVHLVTSKSLKEEICRTRKIRVRVSSICNFAAQVVAWIVSGTLAVLILLGLNATRLLIQDSHPILTWLMYMAAATLIVFTVVNLLIGSSVKNLHQVLVSRISRWLFRFVADRVGLDTSDSDNS